MMNLVRFGIGDIVSTTTSVSKKDIQEIIGNSKMYWDAIASRSDSFLAHRDPKKGMRLIATGLPEQPQTWSNSDVIVLTYREDSRVACITIRKSKIPV